MAKVVLTICTGNILMTKTHNSGSFPRHNYKCLVLLNWTTNLVEASLEHYKAVQMGTLCLLGTVVGMKILQESRQPQV